MTKDTEQITSGDSHEAPAAPVTKSRPKPKEIRRKGLVAIFTGNGKGKSTASFGIALRSAGNRMPVLIVQFIKGEWKTGEVEALAQFAPLVRIERMGRGFTIDHLRNPRITDNEHQLAADAAITLVREQIVSGAWAVVILDEILGAIKAGLVSLETVIGLVEAKPEMLHLILTGRDAPDALIERADLVTEMREIKHPFRAGIMAQRGIEF